MDNEFSQIPREFNDLQGLRGKSNRGGSNGTNGIAVALIVIAIIEFVGAFITGLVITHDWAIRIGCWFGGASFGLLNLAFAEIIKLLERVADE